MYFIQNNEPTKKISLYLIYILDFKILEDKIVPNKKICRPIFNI